MRRFAVLAHSYLCGGVDQIPQERVVSNEEAPTVELLIPGTRVSDVVEEESSTQAEPSTLASASIRKLWKKLRVERGTDQYRIMATVAFWISASFIIGSLLFIVGGVASMANPLLLAEQGGMEPWKQTGLVTYAYLTGGTYFTIGAYLGFFHVINAGNGFNHSGHGFTKIRWCAPPPPGGMFGHGSSAYWGSLCYFIGALFFQLAVCAGVLMPHSWGPVGVMLLEWLPQAVGGVFFTLAALIELHHNRAATWRERVWWLVTTYLLGSALFCAAAWCGLLRSALGDGALERLGLDLGLGPEGYSLWLVDCPYAVGSTSFWIGAWVQLRMWKAEQHGLGFMSELNRNLSKGARPINMCDQLTLMVVTLIATLSVLNIGLVHAYDAFYFAPSETVSAEKSTFLDLDALVGTVASAVMAHAILLLETVLHATPSIHPYDYLIVLLRVVTMLFLSKEVLTSVKLLAFDG